MGLHLELIGKRRLPMPFAYAKTLKKAWHDVKRHFQNDRTSGEHMAAVLAERGIVKTTDRVLDIGAGRYNSFVKALLKKGFKDCLGIDTDKEIRFRRNAEAVNIRDLPAERTFTFIAFRFILDCFRNDWDLHDRAPSTALLAAKIDLHLEPGGLLCFEDGPSYQKDTFVHALEKLGYVREYIGDRSESINEKFILYRKPLFNQNT